MSTINSGKHDVTIALANILCCDDGKLLSAGVCRTWLGLGRDGFRTREKPHPLSIMPYQKEFITENVVSGVQKFLSQIHRASTSQDASEQLKKLMVPHTYGYNAVTAWSNYIFRCGHRSNRESKITNLQSLGITPPYFLCDRIRELSNSKMAAFLTTYQNYLNGAVVSRKVSRKFCTFFKILIRIL